MTHVQQDPSVAAHPARADRRPIQSFEFLFHYLASQRAQVALLGGLLAVSIVLQLANPQVLRRFLDRASHTADDRTLTTAAALFLGIALVQQLCSVIATYLSENIGWSATNTLRADLLLHCLRLDPSFHKTHTPGELIDRIDGDVTAMATFFSQFVLRIVANGALLLGVIVILWRTDERIGGMMTAFSLLALLALRRIQSVAVPLWKVARQQSAELFGFIEERLGGVEDLRSSGAQAYTMRRLYEAMAAHLRAERKARLTGRFVWVTTDLLFAIGTGAAYLLAARLFRSHAMSIGAVFSVFYYIGMLFHPLIQITRQAEAFQKATAGLGRVREILEARPRLADGGGHPLPSGPLAVAINAVRFSYDEDGDSTIDRLSFHLRAGQVLGILGRTGSGKTTLARLLFRLHDPQEGTVLLGGQDLRTVPLADLRRRIGMVTQEVQLFGATVRDNVTLFDPGIPDGRIMEALAELGLTAWLEGLPGGLDTILGAAGGGLSAGEAQLLAFTRVFLKDPGLILLDEASSRLDPATERRIDRAMDRLLTGRTGILIAHRLHTVERADAILILKDRALAEFGERTTLARDPRSRFSRLLATGLHEALE